jgi:drug/metabolite transporter (DMT)-like permease
MIKELMFQLTSSRRRSFQFSNWTWILIALGAHTGWGANPVLGRYLQTISQLPSLSIIGFSNLIILVILTLVILPRLDIRVFRQPILWLFAIIVFFRGTTNLLSTRFTLAIYVQLINLLTPFVVALISTLFLREELPRYTWRAILLALFGALLMTSADMNGTGLKITLGKSDWIGISLSCISTLFLAFYMITARSSVKYAVSGEALLFSQIATLALANTAISFLTHENWAQWRAIGLTDWLVFGVYAIGIMLGSNLGQILALRHLSASLVSSLMAWRLVSTLLFGALLLGERLTSWVQVMGAVIVLVTITWYLWQQGDQTVPMEAN